ncbi:MAG TPA: hypothetical protein VM489_01525 [Burkholderiales bacterium]|nr:hypothetical protein [Burkholderiales bacterium]
MRLLALFLVVAFAVAGCDTRGPAEKAGEKIDRVGEKASRDIERAGKAVRDAVDPKR